MSVNKSGLLQEVHRLAESQNCVEASHFVKGTYEYFHYSCDDIDDRGWGCGYRTLQTICSWIRHNHNNEAEIPAIQRIQEVLVNIQDKPRSFLNSRQWIGSFEVCLVLDHLYGVQSKILHVNKGDELNNIVDKICDHFGKFGSPIMMGGDIDCSSKGIMGIRIENGHAELLVVDPHYVGKEKSIEFLQNEGWVKWQLLSDFVTSSFYNLCLPQVQPHCMK